MEGGTKVFKSLFQNLKKKTFSTHNTTQKFFVEAKKKRIRQINKKVRG